MFNKLNFLLPITNASTSVKIRNINGIVVHVIKEPTCTISVINNIITIKQSAESTTINLQFASKIEAEDAHILLRTKLNELNTIINVNSGTAVLLYNVFSPVSNTTLHVDSNISVPYTFISIKKIWVNGIYISSQYYTVDSLNQLITWLAINDYILDTTDEITIEYV